MFVVGKIKIVFFLREKISQMGGFFSHLIFLKREKLEWLWSIPLFFWWGLREGFKFRKS